MVNFHTIIILINIWRLLIRKWIKKLFIRRNWTIPQLPQKKLNFLLDSWLMSMSKWEIVGVRTPRIIRRHCCLICSKLWSGSPPKIWSKATGSPFLKLGLITKRINLVLAKRSLSNQLLRAAVWVKNKLEKKISNLEISEKLLKVQNRHRKQWTRSLQKRKLDNLCPLKKCSPV